MGFGFTPHNVSMPVHIVLDTRAGTEQLGFVFLGKAGVNALRGDHRSNATGIILDGGCTWHLSGQLSQFVGKLSSRCSTKRVFGFSGGDGIATSLIGDIEFLGVREGKPTLIRVENVLYLPQMGELTLLSEGMFDNEECTRTGKAGVIDLFSKTGKHQFAAAKSTADGLYHCQYDKVNPVVVGNMPAFSKVLAYLQTHRSTEGTGGLVDVSRLGKEDLELWTKSQAHDKFGHCGHEKLRQMGDFTGPEVDCDACKQAKSTRQSYSKESKTEVPSVAHTFVTDVHQFNCYSRTGNRYMLTFVDRKSRYLRVYFIKKKSEVETKTRHFVNWVHTQRGAYPKNIFSDGGGEYITLNLRGFCDQLGINLTHTAPYSPQMNAIAERINRTIEEGATAMLLRSGLDREFWEEAVNHFVFIKNHTPHSKLDGDRPIDVWGEELKEKEGKGLWSIKPLGCSAWYHIPKEARPKGLEHIRSKHAAYLGFHPHKQADMFYDFDRDKIVTGYCKYYNSQVFPLARKDARGTPAADPRGTGGGAGAGGTRVGGGVVGSESSGAGTGSGGSSGGGGSSGSSSGSGVGSGDGGGASVHGSSAGGATRMFRGASTT